MKLLHFLSFLFLALSFSCQTHKPIQEPEKTLSLPEKFSQSPIHMPLESNWWEAFDHPLLKQIVEDGLKENTSLKIAWYRLEQSQKSLKSKEASLWPKLDLVFNAKRQRDNLLTSLNPNKDIHYSTALALTPKLSYEIDLMGRVSSSKQSAYHQMKASEDYVLATQLMVSGQLAKMWLNKLIQQKLYHLTKEQIDTNQSILELVELKYQQSDLPISELLQQQAIIEAKQSALPLIQNAYSTFHQQLVFLSGLSNFEEEGISHFDTALPTLPDLPGLYNPKDLLHLRPDVHLQYQMLLAADQQLAHAISLQFPSSVISLDYQFSAQNLENLFETNVASLAGQIASPIFSAGKIQAHIEVKEAALKESFQNFKQSFFQSLQEIEHSLQNEKNLLEHHKILQQQQRHIQKAFELSKSNYINGISSYLMVLTALNSLQETEVKLIKSEGNILLNRMDLYLALGQNNNKSII
ncbi:hypothetical protein AB751O23_AA_00230 [Chlamydiales bacterium SCGC AB-751-O23]|jgi:outer membrane protein, multidrug efflux system|nr:hypothetical protein AB751O23_AA_00230 [Chlamydiales bacterium SCGC AB-751-O23]